MAHARPSRRLAPDERTVDRFRPHWTALLPAIAWAMLLAAVCGAVLAATPLAWPLVTLCAAAVWALLAGRSMTRWARRRVTLTTHRLRLRAGGQHRDLPLETITDAWYEQRLRDRLTGVGDVLVVLGEGATPVRVADVPDPSGFLGELTDTQQARRTALLGGADHLDVEVVDEAPDGGDRDGRPWR